MCDDDKNIISSNIFHYLGSVFVIICSNTDVAVYYSINDITNLELIGTFKSSLRGSGLNVKVTKFIDENIEVKMMNNEHNTN